MIKLTDLDIYRLAEELSDIAWSEFDRWDKKAQNTIGYQLIRSSDSIAANIAEGYGRYTTPDRKKSFTSMPEVHLKKRNAGCERRFGAELWTKAKSKKSRK